MAVPANAKRAVSAEWRLRLDEAQANAWPSARTEMLDRWQLRLAGGTDRRTNSVWTIGTPDCDLAEALEVAEAFYRRRGRACEVRVGGSSPAGLAEQLLGRGYEELSSHPLVLCAATDALTGEAKLPFQLTTSDVLTPEWLATYAASEERHREWSIESPFVQTTFVPGPKAVYLSARLDDEDVSVGQAVLARGVTVIQCIATRPDRRRLGGAAAVMWGLVEFARAHGIEQLCLAVQNSNDVARHLYESMGFVLDHECRYFSRRA